MSITNLALRGVQFLMALLVMALTGDMISNSNDGNPSIINYAMFCAVFAMLSLLYLIPVAVRDSLTIHPILPVALDVLNTIFWFCGAVALAARLGVHSCSNDDYTERNGVTNGADNRNKRCTEAQASTAFLFFGFAAFLASAVLTGLGSRGSANMRPGGIRARGPAMSQV